MKNHSTICIILLFLNVILAREEWLDPHEMGIGREHIIKLEPHTQKGFHQTCVCENSTKNKNISFLRKVVNILMKSVKYDKTAELYKGNTYFEMTQEDYNYLRHFITGDIIDDSSLRKLDAILQSSFQESFYDTWYFNYIEQITLFLTDAHTVLAMCLLGILTVLWKIQPHNYEFKTLFKMFLPLVYISDFVLRYKAMLEEQEIESYITSKRTILDPSKLGWFDWFVYKWSGEDMEKSALLANRSKYILVTPMHVFADQFEIIVTIMKHLGSGCGNFVMGMIDKSPFYVKIFMFIFACIILLVLLLMFGSYSLGLKQKFNMFHLLHLEVTNPQSEKTPIVQNNPPVNNSPSIIINPGRTKSSLTFKTKKKVLPRKFHQSVTKSIEATSQN